MAKFLMELVNRVLMVTSQYFSMLVAAGTAIKAMPRMFSLRISRTRLASVPCVQFQLPAKIFPDRQ